MGSRLAALVNEPRARAAVRRPRPSRTPPPRPAPSERPHLGSRGPLRCREEQQSRPFFRVGVGCGTFASMTAQDDLTPFLRATDVIDYEHPAVRERARILAAGEPTAMARRSFEWVRDEIRHSADFHVETVSCSASEALAEQAGLCLSKSHLLTALLRANGIPAGLVYQRLEHRGRFVLHGLVAVRLPEVGWYRCDPRGNKPGVNAQFTPPIERLAFARSPGVIDVPGIFPDPVPEVVHALRSSRTLEESLDALPDLLDGAEALYPG